MKPTRNGADFTGAGHWALRAQRLHLLLLKRFCGDQETPRGRADGRGSGTRWLWAAGPALVAPRPRPPGTGRPLRGAEGRGQAPGHRGGCHPKQQGPRKTGWAWPHDWSLHPHPAPRPPLCPWFHWRTATPTVAAERGAWDRDHSARCWPLTDEAWRPCVSRTWSPGGRDGWRERPRRTGARRQVAGER